MAFKFGRKKKAEEAKEEGAEGEAKEAEAKEPPAEGEAKEGEAAAEGEAPKKNKKKMMMMIGAGVVVLLLAGGGAAYFLLGKKDGTETTAEEKSGEKKEGAESTEAGVGVFFDLPQMLVNLNTGGKGTSFIKATITLELAPGTDVKTVEANLPRVMDNYNTFLREMKSSDFYGSAGTYRLKEEMLIRANKLLAPVKVRDVLFRELLVQ